ncbi:MAG: glycosyltransferase [Gammaproteobacteria bacterium]|nr:glycosyltransferase [Gammaproteobacteria bacterium]
MNASSQNKSVSSRTKPDFKTGRKVAILIVNYNGGEYILRCLEALHRQTKKPEGIVVVDNKSTDCSAQEIALKFPEVRLQFMDTNTGFAAANNHGFSLLTKDSSADWVALINPDAIPREDWLSTLMQAVADNPETDVFGSKLVDSEDNNILDGQGDIHHVCGLSWRRHHGVKEQDVQKNNDRAFSPCGAAALYRLSKVNQVGGMDESYFCYHEDVDLMFRLRLIGADFYYVADSVVEHVGSAITGRNSDFSVFHGHRNLVWTYVKDMPGWLFWLYLPQHLLLNMISVLMYGLKGRARIILKSKWEAIKGIPMAIKKRKIIQQGRSVSNIVIWQSLSKGWLKPYLFRRR